DKRLQEAVVAALGRARVGLKRQEVLAYERGEDRLQRLLTPSGQRGQAGPCEGFAEHGGVLDHAPLRRLEVVEPSSDQRVQGLRHLEGLDLALEQSTIDQHSNGLDR